MDDLIMLAVTGFFFVSCYGLIMLCQRLMEDK
jgi:hypothetical protein